MDNERAMIAAQRALALVILWSAAGVALADTGGAPEARPAAVEAVEAVRAVAPPPPPPPPPADDPLAQRVAEFYGRAHDLRTAAVAQHAAEHARIESMQTVLVAQDEALSVALSMLLSAPGRTEQIDAAYGRLDRVVVRARAARASAVDARQRARDEWDQAGEKAEGGPRLLEEAQRALLDAHRLRHGQLDEQVQRWSAVLDRARVGRRSARPEVSKGMLEAEAATQLQAVVDEIVDLPTDIRVGIEARLSRTGTEGAGLGRVQAFGSVLVDLLKLAALLVLVLLIYRHIGGWFGQVLRALDSRSGDQVSTWQARHRFPRWMVGGDLSGLEIPGSVWLRAAVELVGGALFSVGLVSISIPLAWIARVVAARGAVRFFTASVNLVVITPEDTRPALRVTAAGVQEGLRQTVWAFGVLFAVEHVLVRLSIDVLGADRLADALVDLAGVAMWVLSIVVLHRWGPAIRDRVGEEGAEGPLAQWIVAENRLGFLSAVVGAAVLGVRWLFAMGERIIESRAGLSWLAAAIARRQLRDDTQDARTPADPTLLAAIGANALDHLNVDTHVRVIVGAFEAWSSSGRQGMVIVTADRGMGRSAVLARTADRLAPMMPIVRLALPERITDSVDALAWLAQGSGVADPGESEGLARALVEREPTVFIIEDLHRLFLRSVGGYDALRVVLEAMQASSTRHFWICGAHGPAWSFLNGVAAAVPLAVFRTHVALQPLESRQIATWLEARTLAAGAQPRFDALMQRPARGPDGVRMLERATAAYWRVVADAAQGNPTVALGLWLNSLKAGETGSVDVGMFSMPDADDLDELSDDDLFTLTAIVLHDEIHIDALAEALNLPVNRVRAKCRHLEDRGIVTADTVVRVQLSWLPAVERILRRQSFLHRR